jgi:hypothetical protein
VAPEKLLAKAIHDRHTVVFEYHGQSRWVEPHILGEQGPQRHRVLSGYQVGGATSSGRLPSWRTFAVSQIRALKMTPRNFTPPANYNPGDPRFDAVIARA